MLRDRYNVLCPSFGKQLDEFIRIKLLRRPLVDKVVIGCPAICLLMMFGRFTIWESDRVEIPLGVWVMLMPKRVSV